MPNRAELVFPGAKYVPQTESGITDLMAILAVSVIGLLIAICLTMLFPLSGDASALVAQLS